MSAEIMEKASELAEAIAESDELAAMREAEMVMNGDPAAAKIIAEFQKKQKDVYDIQMRGEELTDEDQKSIEEIEGRMHGNTAIKAYIEASENFEHLMRSINLIIARGISGDGGCGCGSDCGPDCGTDCGPSCGCN